MKKILSIITLTVACATIAPLAVANYRHDNNDGCCRERRRECCVKVEKPCCEKRVHRDCCPRHHEKKCCPTRQHEQDEMYEQDMVEESAE